jgi:hypothetical protein
VKKQFKLRQERHPPGKQTEEARSICRLPFAPVTHIKRPNNDRGQTVYLPGFALATMRFLRQD